MKSRKQIEEEIIALEEIKPRVRRFSAFNDDHHAAIDAQIEVLRENLSEDDIFDRQDGASEDELFSADNEVDAAREAAFWRDDDDYEDGSPSSQWEELAN